MNTDKIIEAAIRVASYEMDNQGSPWCGVCHRNCEDCDAEPEGHNFGPRGPCEGSVIRAALKT
jgi:hypothetical protein